MKNGPIYQCILIIVSLKAILYPYLVACSGMFEEHHWEDEQAETEDVKFNKKTNSLCYSIRYF